MSKIPLPKPVWVPTFPINETKSWKEYLDNFGYVVIENVINQDEINKHIDMAWNYFESLGTGISRHDVSTWDDDRWPQSAKGILLAGQCEFMWSLREIAHTIFSLLYETKDLAVSFDGFSVFRPPEINIKWQTQSVPWYHTDQNEKTKPGQLCIQGQFALMDATDIDGGLVVVPQSQSHFQEMFESYPELGNTEGDFIPLYKPETEQIWTDFLIPKKLQPIKVCHKRGCFVLWDSRTIHCNSPALVDQTNLSKPVYLQIRRLTGFICMIPMSFLNEQDKEKRRQVVLKGETTTHWPIDCVGHLHKKAASHIFKIENLSPVQKSMIPF